MNEFSTKQELLFYSFPLQAEERNKIDGILALLDRSGIAELVRQHSKKGEGGRPSYNPYKLFAAVLLGFSFGASSLRNMESACRNDLRFIYVMDGEIPAYTTICSFINETILPIKDELFFMIMKTIFDDFHLDMNTCFIDGTKIEADANRYKFVWKPTKWHQALDGKARSLLAIMGLADDLPKGGYLPSLLVASKIDKAKTLLTEDKAWNKKLENLTAYLLKIIEYEEKERICGSYRNSYYKTDHDATAMCLKQDYYSGLGSSMHAAYSIQFITSYGFVVAFLVSQDRTDMYVFARTIDKFRESYGFYPSRI